QTKVAVHRDSHRHVLLLCLSALMAACGGSPSSPQPDAPPPITPPPVTPPPDSSAPTAPSGLTGAPASSSQIDLSWIAASDNVAVTGYQVQRCQGANCANFAQVAAPTATTLSDGGLTAATPYSYRVRAADAAGNLSGYSAVVSAATPAAADVTAPTVPANLQAVPASFTQINLSWAASADDVGVTGYLLERCQGVACTNFAQIAAPATAGFNDTGLTTASAYSYRVRAADAAGNLSGYSTPAGAATPVD